MSGATSESPKPDSAFADRATNRDDLFLSGVGVWKWTLATETVHFSQEWRRLRCEGDEAVQSEGEDSPELLIRTVHPDDRQELQSRHLELRRGASERFSLDYRVRQANGAWRWVEERTRAVRDDTGQVAWLVGCEVDITDRKRQETEFQESQRRYAALSSALPVAICQFEQDRCVYASELWSRLSGRPSEFALDLGWIEAIHPDDRESILAFGDSVLEGPPNEEIYVDGVDGRYVRPDGTECWFETKQRIQYDSDGKQVMRTIIVIDVTERRELEQQRERLTAIIEATTDYIGVGTPDRQVIRVNKPLADLCPALLQTGIDFAIAHPPWAMEVVRTKAMPTAIEHGIWSGETALLDGDGNEVAVSQVLIAHRSDGGEVEAFSTIMRDITHQKEVENALRDSERKFATLASSAPVAIFRMTADPLDCIYVNQRWSELTGRPCEAALGRRWMDIVHTDDVKILTQKANEFASDPDQTIAEPYEVRHVLPDGTHRWVQAHIAKEFHEDGSISGFVGTLTDISLVKDAEEELRQTNERFSKLLEFSSIGVWEWDFCEGRLTWDDQMLKIYGLDRGDFHGRYSDWTDRLHPEDLERMTGERESEALSNEETRPTEFRSVRPDGEVRHVYSNVYVERDDGGKPVRAIGINMDITDRRAAEKALIESNAKFQRIGNRLPGMVYRYVVHPDGTDELLYVSPGIRELYELEPEEAVGSMSRVWDRTHEDDRKWLAEEVAASAEQLVPFVFEFRLNLPTKGVRWVEAYSQPFRADNGDVIWDGIILDNTERKSAQLELEKAQARMRRITENVPGMIYRFVLAADGTESMSYVSTKCREMFEVEPDEALRDTAQLFKVIHPDDVNRIQEAVRNSSVSLQPFKEEYRVVLPKQGLRWRQSIGQPFRNETGETVWDGVVIDITHRKHAEHQLQHVNEELARATKMKDQFLANMSHELRTPLNAILGMTDGLRDGVFGAVTERQLDSFDVILQSGSHLMELINDVLDLAKIDSGSLGLEFTSVDISRLCDSSLQLVAPQAEEKKLHLKSNRSFDLPPIQADETRLRQVLVNLLSNAVKFTPEGGSITLDVERASGPNSLNDDVLRVSVSDTGIGVDEKELGLLFEPFYQVDRSLSRKFPGTGLGLALVKQYVELHGGTVTTQSQPGVGSCFTIEIPYGESSTHRERVRRPALGEVITFRESRESDRDARNTIERPPNVLLVEDSEPVAAATQQYLEATNFSVSLAIDGELAVQMARNLEPDLILMDIQLPKVNGLEAIKRIRDSAALGTTPIVVVTGFTSAEQIDECRKAGADRFLAKPYRMGELVKTMRELLGVDAGSPETGHREAVDWEI